MIVLDASVLVNALTDDGPVGQAGRAALAQDVHWAAPEHLVVETFSAVRGRYLGRKITEQRASDTLATLGMFTIELMSTQHLLPRMWSLRGRVSGYDAAYLAAAESAGCPLVTADARLSRVGGLPCEIRLSLPVQR